MLKNKEENHVITICRCGSMEHQLHFCYDEEHNEMDLYVHLADWHRFFKRIWVAIKYIFGYKSRFGEFDSVMINEEDRDELIKFLKKLKTMDEINIERLKEKN